MNSKILLMVFLITLVGCSKDESFVCDGWGLTISDKQALYGASSTNFCRKAGVVNIYADDCNKKNNYTLMFDTVSHELTIMNSGIATFNCSRAR